MGKRLQIHSGPRSKFRLQARPSWVTLRSFLNSKALFPHKHPKFGMKTAGGGKEGSWALVITLDLGSEREKGAFVGLSRKDNPGRATARAEALRPGAFSRVSGEPEPGVGVGWSPAMKPPLTPHQQRLRDTA